MAYSLLMLTELTNSENILDNWLVSFGYAMLHEMV